MYLQTRTKRIALLAVSYLLLTLVWACGTRGAGGATAGQSSVAATPGATHASTAERIEAPVAQATIQLALPTLMNGPAPAATTGWSQLGGNPQRTHYVDASLPASSGALNQTWRVLWVWNGPNGDSGPAAGHLALPKGVAPIVGDGRLYIGHSDGVVRAINAATGSLAWSQSVGGQIQNVGAYDAATQAVYVGSTNGRLFKLRAADGQILDEFNAGAEIRQAVLLVGDTAYIGTMAGNFYAVRLETMEQRWAYSADGSALLGSAAYASKGGGLLIFPSEDKSIHAVRVADGTRAWRVAVNAGEDPQRDNRRFPDSFPVVAEAADAVIIRSYFKWGLTWSDAAGAPSSQSAIRDFIANGPEYESFIVLDLDDGARRFIAPVLSGGIGNNDDYYSSPPQAVVKRLPDGKDVAYVLWRNRDACRAATCDGREDSTIGEMDLQTGAIRFVEDHKNAGTIRLPTDEQGALSMVGDVIFHSHWMSLGALRIPNRATGGSSFSSPISSQEYMSVSQTLGSGQCAERNTAQRFCPVGHNAGGDEGYQLDPGFYLYYGTKVYDTYFSPPVRGAIFDSGVLYWKSVDGAIIAVAPTATSPASPSPSVAPSSSPSVAPSSSPSASPSTAPGDAAAQLYLPLLLR